MFHAFRCHLLCVAMLAGGMMSSHAGLTAYTDRGKTDFDTALQLLNPYGTWSKIDGVWGFTPTDHLTPYTDGQWIYTEYGWYWKGHLPHSWVTEHYGYWKRGADKVWSWYPGPYWLPQTVEIRATSTHIGWRSAAVDEDGNFVEHPLDRYAKIDEWTFVTLAQFAGQITPKIIAPADTVGDLLDDSVDCRHTYFTYREIDRPGPHPADFLKFKPEGGMLAPRTLQDELATQPPPPSPIVPGLNANVDTVNARVAAMTGTNAPTFMDSLPPPGPETDKRRVKYWITMSLPTYWTKPPADAKPEEIYLYRPDFYQDEDGINRRITLWFNPTKRTTLKELLGDKLPAGNANPNGNSSAVSGDQPPRNPFQIPLDNPNPPEIAPPSVNSSSKHPASTPPSGMKEESGPFSSPSTNAAPTNPP